MKKFTQEDGAALTEFLQKLTDFSDRKTEDCIHCGKHVVSLRKVGRCVYANPCGCRLWQGDIPEAWK